MTDASCAVAHGAPAPESTRTLVVVFASPVAEFLLRYAPDLGYRPVLVDPEPARAARHPRSAIPELDEHAEVVVTDHHRPELGPSSATPWRRLPAGSASWATRAIPART